MDAVAAGATLSFSASVTGASASPTVPATSLRALVALAVLLLLVGARRRRAVCAGAVALALLAWAPLARGETPYCAKVRARADDDAALLMGPRVYLQGLRFPNNGVLDGGAVFGQGLQARAGLLFSATDLYKGLGVRPAADAECREHDARLELESAMATGDDGARRAAFEAESAFLEAHDPEVRDWVAKAGARFTDHVVTLVELQDVRALANALERKLVQARGQARQLAARSTSDAAGPARLEDVRRLATSYANAAADFTHAVERVRAGDPWQLDVTAGVVSYPRADWYGIVQLGFNLGGLGGADGPSASRRRAVERSSRPPTNRWPRCTATRERCLPCSTRQTSSSPSSSASGASSPARGSPSSARTRRTACTSANVWRSSS